MKARSLLTLILIVQIAPVLTIFPVLLGEHFILS